MISLVKSRPILMRLLWIVLAVWGVKIWLSIVAEYRWYFPPNFAEAEFLIGRKEYFVGIYRVAFYAHILASPIAIALTTLLLVASNSIMKDGEGWIGAPLRPLLAQPERIRKFWKWHRRVGKFAVLLTVVLVVPSGLVMAWGTLFGPIAAFGFTAHSLATLVAALSSIHFARARNIRCHQSWSTVCCLLLCGPLVFRVTSGLSVVTGVESEWVYQLNAWTSWILLPLIWLFSQLIKSR